MDYTKRAKNLLDQIIGRTTYKEIANLIETSPQNMSHKLINGTLKVTELLKIADAFEASVKVEKPDVDV